MIDEPVYTASKERMAPQVKRFSSERTPAINNVKWPLHCFVQPITQHYKRRTVREVPLQSIQSP